MLLLCSGTHALLCKRGAANRFNRNLPAGVLVVHRIPKGFLRPVGDYKGCQHRESAPHNAYKHYASNDPGNSLYGMYFEMLIKHQVSYGFPMTLFGLLQITILLKVFYVSQECEFRIAE